MSVHPLKTYRESKSPPLSQRGLAKILNVRRETVARWESGKRKIDGEMLLDVAEKTGIPKAELRPDLAALMGEAAQ